MSKIEDKQRRLEVQFAKQYKLMKEKIEYDKEKKKSQNETLALLCLNKVVMDNQQAMASRYAVRKAKSKDIRSEAMGYRIRNRKVIEEELDFQKDAGMKFKESLMHVDSGLSEMDQATTTMHINTTSQMSDEITILETTPFSNKAAAAIKRQ